MSAPSPDAAAVELEREPPEGNAVESEPARRDPARSHAGADFGEVVSAFETPLLRYLRRVARPDEAEDIAQEAFLRLHHEIARRGVTSVPGFLFRAAHNLALDSRRRRQTRDKYKDRAREMREPDDDSPEGLAAMIRRAACEKALEELAKLPAKQRRVLLLKVIQDFSLREIARITGASAGGVAHHLNAGLTELARRLKAAGVI